MLIVLSNKWISNKVGSVEGSIFIPEDRLNPDEEANCIVIGKDCGMNLADKDEELECYAVDLFNVIDKELYDVDKILTNSQKILTNHTSVDWPNVIEHTPRNGI